VLVSEIDLHICELASQKTRQLIVDGIIFMLSVFYDIFVVNNRVPQFLVVYM
jgi:hypothetical protein